MLRPRFECLFSMTLLPGLAAAAAAAATPVHVVFYRTYMPPRSLLLQPWEHGGSAGVLHGRAVQVHPRLTVLGSSA